MPPGWLAGYFDVLATNMQTEMVQLLQGKIDLSMQSNKHYSMIPGAQKVYHFTGLEMCINANYSQKQYSTLASALLSG